ncbi:MAG: hypothetical protein AAF844_11800 [Pseudomonadota bacterium]
MPPGCPQQAEKPAPGRRAEAFWIATTSEPSERACAPAEKQESTRHQGRRRGQGHRHAVAAREGYAVHPTVAPQPFRKPVEAQSVGHPRADIGERQKVLPIPVLEVQQCIDLVIAVPLRGGDQRDDRMAEARHPPARIEEFRDGRHDRAPDYVVRLGLLIFVAVGERLHLAARTKLQDTRGLLSIQPRLERTAQEQCIRGGWRQDQR